MTPIRRQWERRVSGLTAFAVILGGCTSSGGVAPHAVPPAGGQANPTSRIVPSAPVVRSPISQKVVFGDPWSSKPSSVHAISRSALALINGTRKGQVLTASVFNLTYVGTAAALIRAHLRGVDVRVLLNSEGTDAKQVERLKRALGTRTNKRSWVVIRSSKFRMHSKFLLVSASNTRPVTVWVSSGNLTEASGRDQANDALVTHGDKPLYSFLARQFYLMRRGVTDPAELGRSAITPTATVRTFPIPSGGAGRDPVESMLRDVTCLSGGRPTTVRLAHYYFTDNRLYLVDLLRELKASGCVVRVVGELGVWGQAVKDALTAPGPGRIELRVATGTILHTKITSIDGWDSSGHPLKIAMVGTHNLSGRGLTVTPDGVNDEVALTVGSSAVVNKYNAWVDRFIRYHSKVAA